MVGVPGRSKGCITCRKRKKGCDLQRPECGQCKERGTPCSGYDTDRVFVYHNGGKNRASGRTPDVSYSCPTPGLAATPFTRPQLLCHPKEMIPATSSMKQVLNSYSLSLHILPLSFSRSAYDERSLEAFMTMYVPGGDVRNTNVEGKGFVDIVPRLKNKDEALRLTVLAIGTVALGNQTNDTSLTRQGRGIYGKALMETRRALQDPNRARSAAILLIPQVMGLYEILFGAEANSSKQAQSWLSHAEGEVAMIVARGPEAYIDDPAHSIFIYARIRPLIAAARMRKRSVLNEARWKTIPWTRRVKTAHDSLIDIFAEIPEVLENVDRFGCLSPDTLQDKVKDLETSAKCWTLHIQLQEWLTVHEHEIHTPVTTTATPIMFPNFDVACLTVRYWVMALQLYSTLDTASRIPPTDTTLAHADRPHPRQFARLIARAAPYFFQEEFGIEGPTTFSFPLGNALLYMRRDPELDAEYSLLVRKTWNNPTLPRAIKSFLDSMRASVTTPPPPKVLIEKTDV